MRLQEEKRAGEWGASPPHPPFFFFLGGGGECRRKRKEKNKRYLILKKRRERGRGAIWRARRRPGDQTCRTTTKMMKKKKKRREGRSPVLDSNFFFACGGPCPGRSSSPGRDCRADIKTPVRPADEFFPVFGGEVRRTAARPAIPLSGAR